MAKLTIRKFKHNTANKAFEILIARENSALVCPVQTLLDYCGLRDAASGPLFCESDLRPVTISSFNTELKRCLVFCGLDTSRYKGYSFRIGAATHASEQGFSDSQIRKLGRWQSDAFKTTYVQVLSRLMPKTIKAANFDVPDLVQTRAREFILSKYSSIVQSWAAILARLGLSIICLMLNVSCTQY